MPSSEELNEAENPYAAPGSSSTTSPVAVGSQESQQEELRAFVGAKADYYLVKWTPLVKGWGRSAGFNWAAFFLTGLWLPYRKMYKVTAIFYGIILVESLAEDVLFVNILGEAEPPALVGRIVSLATWIICGSYGNRWYLSHARKVISEVGFEGMEREVRLQMISQRGGTSLGAAIGCFFAFLIVMFAAFMALEFLLYPG